MSRGISAGKQKKKLPIRLKAVDTRTVVQEGWMDSSPLEFFICCSISKRFYLQWNAFDLLYKMKVYFMGGGAAGGL